MLMTERDRLVPVGRRGLEELLGARVAIDRVRGVAVHPHDLEERLAVLGEPGERRLALRHLGRHAVGVAGQDRGERAADRAP